MTVSLRGDLVGDATKGTTVNRSLTLPEGRVLRRLNEAVFDAERVSWSLYRTVAARGAMNPVINERVLSATEPRQRMPRWAVELAVRDGKLHGDHIALSGVRVVGDLTSLHRPPDLVADRGPLDDRIAPDIAVETVIGLVHSTVPPSMSATSRSAR